MITSIARQSIIIKCNGQQAVLLGNYELYYAAGLMKKLFDLPLSEDQTPQELMDIILPANSDPRLVRLALQAAQATGFGRIRHCDDIVVKDDHSAFHDAGLPALDLIDFEFGSAPGLNDYWHTPQDTLDKISTASLLASGRLAAELVRLLQR